MSTLNKSQEKIQAGINEAKVWWSGLERKAEGGTYWPDWRDETRDVAL